MRSAEAKDICFSNHNAFMVTPIDPMRMIWSAVQRKSKSGVVLGPDERVDVITAIKALTINPAWHYREEARKGSIEVGKLADLVILDKNPLTVPVDDILGIEVVETFKDGQSIYAARVKAGLNDEQHPPARHASRQSRFAVDDGPGVLPTGCACCDGTWSQASRDRALQSMARLG